MQRRRAGLLRARQNEVEAANLFATLAPKHRWKVIQRMTIGEGGASRTIEARSTHLAIRKSARALAHSKTLPQILACVRRLRFGVRRCSAAFN
jgi:hypothetical protein